MAASTVHGEKATLVTCPTCDYSVPQAPGTKRTICPNCGNFYSRELAERPPSPRRRIRQDRVQRGSSYNESQVSKKCKTAI